MVIVKNYSKKQTHSLVFLSGDIYDIIFMLIK